MGHDIHDLIAGHAAHGQDFVHAELSGRDGSCLVGANDICPGKRLNGRHLLDEGFFVGQTSDTDDEGDGGQEDKTLRDHADDAGDGADDCICKYPSVRDHLTAVEQQAYRDDDHGDDLDDSADRALHLGARALLVGRFRDQLGSVALVADFVDALQRGAGYDEAA